jgi:hypothetical protein
MCLPLPPLSALPLQVRKFKEIEIMAFFSVATDAKLDSSVSWSAVGSCHRDAF